MALSMASLSLSLPRVAPVRQFKAAAMPAAAPAKVSLGRRQLQVSAARIAGVDVPNQKLIETSLTYVFGIGPTTAKSIMAETGIENKRTRDLSEDELIALRSEVEKYQVEGDLRRFNSLSIKRLKEIQCYRGKRHIAGLPMRGQHTKNNARTRKGKRVAIAGTKKAPMK